MKLNGQRRLAVGPDGAWNRLLDVESLRRCIPGCEQLSATDDYSYQATVSLKIGPIRARFSGKVQLKDLIAPSHCRIVGEGTGGVAGFAKGDAALRLVAEAGGSVLDYEANVEIGGKIAALGDRLFRSVVERNIGDFFDRLEAELS